jgi:hypothetical protein
MKRADIFYRSEQIPNEAENNANKIRKVVGKNFREEVIRRGPS